MEQKLYLVHCGFYDGQTSFGGVYEGHTNLILVSESPQNARLKAKAMGLYKEKRMHIDGIQEIVAVGGFRVSLIQDSTMAQPTEINSHIFRELAPPKTGE
jgi:hypothetical protein